MHWYTAVFRIEDALGPFQGYTTGQRWNGWACPAFPQAEANAIMAVWNRTGIASLGATYAAETDTYTFWDIENEAEPYCVHGVLQMVEGQAVRLYPIGAGAWCWDEEEA
jgi:hypothetical protein